MEEPVTSRENLGLWDALKDFHSGKIELNFENENERDVFLTNCLGFLLNEQNCSTTVLSAQIFF